MPWRKVQNWVHRSLIVWVLFQWRLWNAAIPDVYIRGSFPWFLCLFPVTYLDFTLGMYHCSSPQILSCE